MDYLKKKPKPFTTKSPRLTVKDKPTTEMTCNLGMNIGNKNGQNMVLEKLLITTSKKKWDVKLLIGAYANNLRTGEGLTTPDQFYVASDQIRKMNLNAS